MATIYYRLKICGMFDSPSERLLLLTLTPAVDWGDDLGTSGLLNFIPSKLRSKIDK